MTCGFCKYQFCWACGGSASLDDNHFVIGNGCGVRMMDNKVKAMSKAPNQQSSIYDKHRVKIWMVILALVLLPLTLVIICPCFFVYMTLKD